MQDGDSEFLLWLTALLLAADLGFTLAWIRRNRRAVGRVLHLVRRRRRARASSLAVVVLAAVLVVLAGGDVPQAASVAVLAIAFTVIAVSPGFTDSVYGEEGVQRGWHARRFGELEEWRLSGDHLRWRLFGEWVATDVPAGMQLALRSKLERACPGRESPHGNRGLDPERLTPSQSQSTRP